MSLLRPAETTTAYLKMAFMGFQGSGKTYTATSTAIGLVLMMREMGIETGTKPIAFMDTEKGSDWIKPRVEKAGIGLITAKTRSFSDLLSIVPEAQASASLLLVDSLTHCWVDLCDSYMKAKNRTRLQFEDWAFLKTRWRQFTDLFVNSPLHIIVCGRAGFEYDYSVDDETGKKNLEKTGIKMKAEGEMGYEPDLLVLMEREMDMATTTNHHVARVLKDRSTLLDGKDFSDPTFENFLPHIRCLNLGGVQLGVDTTRTSVHTIPKDIRDNRRTQRKIVLAEIEDLLVLHYPGQSSVEKKTKLELLREHFKASWVEMEEVMPLDQLRAGYDKLHVELEGKPSRYGEQKPAADNLELPEFLDRRPAANAKPNGAPIPAPVAAPSQTDPNWINEFLQEY
jgi:hypothetical protein